MEWSTIDLRQWSGNGVLPWILIQPTKFGLISAEEQYGVDWWTFWLQDQLNQTNNGRASQLSTSVEGETTKVLANNTNSLLEKGRITTYALSRSLNLSLKMRRIHPVGLLLGAVNLVLFLLASSLLHHSAEFFKALGWLFLLRTLVATTAAPRAGWTYVAIKVQQ